ncbi:MAG: hypothetical protein ACO3C1_11815 [Ilumatobacteraceae bacterium]
MNRVRSRRSPHHGFALVAPALGVATVLSACAPTTYDASLATTIAVSTTTTLPVGSAAELLPAMVDEVKGLSARVEAGDGERDAAARIAQLWAAIADEVTASHPDLVEDFEFVVSRCTLAAERHRPADADRAYKNLVVLAATVTAG